ncbi:MAG: M48 family metallopeptidase [Gammaproteobacteria bacterium]|nr:M48 family metallopeptidase [Gammaproteobacteria bacterium]
MQHSHALEQLRFEYETHLFNDLTRQPQVREWQNSNSRQQHFNLRKRHLLGTAVRISKSLFPELYEIYQNCLRRIGNEINGHLYVHQASEYNANVCSHDQRFDMLVTSALAKDFKPLEIAFVIGHELGHVLFKHNRIPASTLLFDESGPGIPADLAKRLFQWSRAAEISADRLGFMTCGDLSGAANAFFKLASGLQLNDDNRVVKALHAQFEEIAHLTGEIHKGNITYASTHPLIPIRFKSLELISLDLLALRNTGKDINKRDLSMINQKVQRVLADTEPVNIQEFPGAAEEFDESFVSLQVLCALFVAISDGELVLTEETFVRNLARRVQGPFLLDEILSECRKNAPAFRKDVLKELDAGNVSQDAVLQLMHTCAVMCGDAISKTEIKAMKLLCQTLKGSASLVDSILSTEGT